MVSGPELVAEEPPPVVVGAAVLDPVEVTVAFGYMPVVMLATEVWPVSTAEEVMVLGEVEMLQRVSKSAYSAVIPIRNDAQSGEEVGETNRRAHLECSPSPDS